MKKLIVITGVSRGLGRAMTDEFIRLGHTVIGCARSKSAVENLTNKYESPHIFTCVNVADENSVQDWAGKTLTNYSSPDLLINNASIINQPAPIWKVDSQEFSQLIDINIKVDTPRSKETGILKKSKIELLKALSMRLYLVDLSSS